MPVNIVNGTAWTYPGNPPGTSSHTVNVVWDGGGVIPRHVIARCSCGWNMSMSWSDLFSSVTSLTRQDQIARVRREADRHVYGSDMHTYDFSARCPNCGGNHG